MMGIWLTPNAIPSRSWVETLWWTFFTKNFNNFAKPPLEQLYNNINNFARYCIDSSRLSTKLFLVPHSSLNTYSILKFILFAKKGFTFFLASILKYLIKYILGVWKTTKNYIRFGPPLYKIHASLVWLFPLSSGCSTSSDPSSSFSRNPSFTFFPKSASLINKSGNKIMMASATRRRNVGEGNLPSFFSEQVENVLMTLTF